jgi:hypothetical protein
LGPAGAGGGFPLYRGLVVPSLASLLLACAAQTAAPELSGEIDDSALRIDAGSVPANSWLELENVGTEPCALVAMLSPVPANELPIEDGRITMSLSGDPGLPAPVHYYAELNNRPVDRGDGVMTGEGWVTEVGPGDRVRLQIAFEGPPEGTNLVVACNEPGGFSAGRYADLEFAP